MTRTSIVAMALLHFLWQGALIHLTLALALRAIAPHRANLRYSLGVAALLLMALAPIVTAGLLARPAATPLDETLPLLTQPVVAPGSGALDDQRESAARSRAPALAAPLRNAAAALSPLASPLQPAMPWLVAAWLTGVVMLAMRLLGGWMRLRSIVRSGRRPNTPLYDEMVARLGARLRVSRPVRVLESAAVHAPAVIGWLRPVLLVPASMIGGLTVPQLEAILAHELAHVRRHDYAVNMLQTVIETVLFYHPAVWWVSRQVRREREHCCDDLAVATSGDARLFASALLDLLLVTEKGQSVAERISSPQETLHAPHLIDLEVAQVLRRYVAHGRLDEERAKQALDDLRDLDLNRYPHDVLLSRIWELRNHASAYDAAYLALAEALDAPLLTSDAGMRSVPDARAVVEIV